MKYNRRFFCVILVIIVCAAMLPSCGGSSKKTAVRTLIIPKFEIGDMAGDVPGEAQLFYEKYCPDCEEIEIPNMPPTGHFYYNDKNGVGLLVTGSGKTAAGLSLSVLLSSGLYDFSDTTIVSVGCAGGSASRCTLGDVILVTAVCDYDLGHHVDAHEKENSGNHIMWFPDDSYSDYSYETLDADLCEEVYDMIRDCPLKTTKKTKTVMRRNFKDRGEEDIIPAVKKGTVLSADNYWKGIYGHETAKYIVKYYGCPDPYSASEMEEIAIANTAECFGMLDRLISLRVIVNMDVFLDDQTPESTWGEDSSFNEKVADDNTETLDIFEPAMHNLFDTGSRIIDASLKGEL